VRFNTGTQNLLPQRQRRVTTENKKRKKRVSVVLRRCRRGEGFSWNSVNLKLFSKPIDFEIREPMSNPTHILVIDDEPQILRALNTILTAKQFRVSAAARGADGLTLAAAGQPDLIILDMSLPDMEGIEVCKQLREWTATPIIILSVRDGEKDKVAALDAGADDYLTKPFGIEELLARVRVALRHKSQAAGGTKRALVHAGNLEVDLAGFVVKKAGAEISLTATEFKLLAYLASHAGRVLTHTMILSNVWDPAEADKIEYLRVYVRQLRKKLEADPDQPQILITEPGIGYRFMADD
jgi:two-component system KDP operon response regulator KdpE